LLNTELFSCTTQWISITLGKTTPDVMPMNHLRTLCTLYGIRCLVFGVWCSVAIVFSRLNGRYLFISLHMVIITVWLIHIQSKAEHFSCTQ